MVEIINAVTSLLVSIVMVVVALSIIPALIKLLVPSVRDMIWRGYWRPMRWAFTLPFRLLTLLVWAGGRPRDPGRPRGGAR